MAPKEFAIASFNVENLERQLAKTPEDSARLWDARKKVLRAMLRRLSADVLLLQEVHEMAALDELLTGTPYEKFHRAHTRTRGGRPFPKRNLVILSRWPIEGSEQYMHRWGDAPRWLRITARPREKESREIGWERPILHARIRLRGRLLHALNLHLKSMNPTDIPGQTDEQKFWLWKSHAGWAEGYFLSDIKRVGQALEARILLDRLFEREGEDAWIVVGGDFNAEVGSVPFRAIVGSVEDTQNPSLRSTVLVPCEFNVPPDKRYTLIHHGHGNMLDHVIVSQALYPYWKETAIFNEVLKDESVAFASEEKFPESDHAPVVARFAVPAEWLA